MASALHAYEIDCDGRGPDVWEVYEGEGAAAVYVDTVSRETVGTLQTYGRLPVVLHTLAEWEAMTGADNG